MPKVLAVFLFMLGLTASLMGGDVVVLTVDDAITPVTAHYLSEGIRAAEKSQADAVVIVLDTPGGHLDATLKIDKMLLSAKVPVAVYVSPSGGRAASAGVFITYAAHVAAMAPATNIGSAHPVTLAPAKGDSASAMMEKITNDAVAHIQGLARQRGRNEQWAEAAVRHSKNITETEALKLGVINFVAGDIRNLLQQMDGLTVNVDGEETTLQTARAVLERRPMSWRHRILDKIASPVLAYYLFIGGIMGLFFELRNPGALFPGILGAILLILGLFTMQVLPINAAGILLILLAVLFFVLESYTPTFGLLTTGGVIAMVLGSLMLFKSPELSLSLGTVLPAALGMGLFFLALGYMALKAQTKRVTTGVQGMTGETATVLRSLPDGWQVGVHGEIWKARSADELSAGDAVEVIEVQGMMLTVRKVSSSG